MSGTQGAGEKTGPGLGKSDAPNKRAREYIGGSGSGPGRRAT